jgi:hypothetical protein
MKINKVLAIAINDYDDDSLNKMQNCKNDVSSIIKTLNDKYEIDDVEFISDKSETTRKSLYNKLNEYFINRLDDENVLLIYAGHGEYNEKLNAAYWQPSDSDPTDSSSWISISDILTFINASKAFHIGIISDSCYSGAMFEPPKRGGGIDSFNSKKSRLGLTSGGIEKVSDGQKGKSSPFANLLIETLEQNTKEELPFSILGPNLMMEFTTEKNQTPMFGPLNNVGHEGGSFTFKLKQKKKESLKINNKNAFLKETMSNLFIPISDKDLEIIIELEQVKILKTKAVNEQKYEVAAKARDVEKSLENKLKENTSDYIDSLLPEIKFNSEEIEKSEILDVEIEDYLQELELEKNLTTEEIMFKKHGIKPSEIRGDLSKKQLNKYIEVMIRFNKRKNPSEKLFLSEKENLVSNYKINIINVYECIVRVKCKSKSEFFKSKIHELKEILIEIYLYEIGLLINGYSNELEELMANKEIEVKILNWIKHK